MSYQEKNIIVSLFSTSMIFGFYFLRVFQMYQEGSFNSTSVFSLWATIIILGIIVNVVSSILTHIVFSVIHKIRTNEDEPHMADERDELFTLKGTKNSYLVFSIGVFLSMLMLVMGKSPLMMFNLLIFSGLAAQVIGDVSQLYFYRRGY